MMRSQQSDVKYSFRLDSFANSQKCPIWANQYIGVNLHSDLHSEQPLLQHRQAEVYYSTVGPRHCYFVPARTSYFYRIFARCSILPRGSLASKFSIGAHEKSPNMSLNLGNSDRQLTADSVKSLSDAEKMELQQFLSNESQKANIQESPPSHAFIHSIYFSIPALNRSTSMPFP